MHRLLLALALPVATLAAAVATAATRTVEPARSPVVEAVAPIAPARTGAGGGEPSCPDPANPEQPCNLPPSQLDDALGVDGPPVYGKPSYTFGRGDWAKCEIAPNAGFSQWDGCDPFTGPATYYHYAKPYGRSAEDAAAFAAWEPGRFERGLNGARETGHYYQSDEWVGPVSWNDGYYGGNRDGHWCGGAYYQDVRYGDPNGEQQAAPGFEDGRGGQFCS